MTTEDLLRQANERLHARNERLMRLIVSNTAHRDEHTRIHHERAAMTQLFADGTDLHELAKAFKCSTTTVRRRLGLQ